MVAFRSLLTMVILTVGSLMAVDFQRDIRPVLASHCFKCHGPDDKARKAKLRLDERPDAGPVKADYYSNASTITDPEELMPPPAAKEATVSYTAKEYAARNGSTTVPNILRALGVHRTSIMPPRPKVKAGRLAATTDHGLASSLARIGEHAGLKAIARGRSPPVDPPPLAGPYRPAAHAG